MSSSNDIIYYRPIPDLPALQNLVINDSSTEPAYYLLIHSVEGSLTYKMDVTKLKVMFSGSLDDVTKELGSLKKQVQTISGQLPNFLLKTDISNIKLEDLNSDTTIIFGGWFTDEEAEADPEADSLLAVRIRMRQGAAAGYPTLLGDIETGEIAFVKDTGAVLIGKQDESGKTSTTALATVSKGTLADRPATSKDSTLNEAYAGRVYVAEDQNNTIYLDIGGTWVNVSSLPSVGNGLTFDDDGLITVKPWVHDKGEIVHDTVPVRVDTNGVGLQVDTNVFLVSEGKLTLSGTIKGGTFATS